MAVKAPSNQFSAGRSDHFGAGYVSPLYYGDAAGIASPVLSHNNKLPVFTHAKSVSDGDRAAAFSASPNSSKQQKLRASLRSLDTKMSSSTTTTTLSATTPRRLESRRASLHKRGTSSSSLPGSPAAIVAANVATQSQFSTPYATFEEPFPNVSPAPTSSTPKIKPYLRKMSSSKDDAEQGRLDLSKSVTENGALAGLGIHDFGVRSVSDGPQTGWSIHTRNTSVGSQISTGSGSFRPTPSFIHPLRPTPTRPYTPPTDASSMNDEEAHESSDVVPEDDVQPIHGLRVGRSMSLSSPPQIPAPTPLSQSHTPADLGYVPKLTSTSQTNLSVRSGRSLKSSLSKLGRPRGDTNRSVELLTSPSSRTSLDRTTSFVSRHSDPDPVTRDERIREARRKFEEKEANKDRKMESLAFKRRESELAKKAKKQERQKRKSEASEKPRIAKSKSKRLSERKGSELLARRYDETQITAPPMHGLEPGKSEEPARHRASPAPPKGGWTRFSVWFQTRMRSCRGKRS